MVIKESIVEVFFRTFSSIQWKNVQGMFSFGRESKLIIIFVWDHFSYLSFQHKSVSSKSSFDSSRKYFQ